MKEFRRVPLRKGAFYICELCDEAKIRKPEFTICADCDAELEEEQGAVMRAKAIAWGEKHKCRTCGRPCPMDRTRHCHVCVAPQDLNTHDIVWDELGESYMEDVTESDDGVLGTRNYPLWVGPGDSSISWAGSMPAAPASDIALTEKIEEVV